MRIVLFYGTVIGSLFFADPTRADRMNYPIAVFSGLDKITGHITTFSGKIGELYRFGTLELIPQVCYSNSDDDVARVDGFVEVNEITLDRKKQRIFTGWMFADSPGLNAVEHPIYDIWLKECNSDTSGDFSLPIQKSFFSKKHY